MRRYYIKDKEGDLIVLIFGINSYKPVAYAKCNLQTDIKDIAYILTPGLRDLVESKGLTLFEID